MAIALHRDSYVDLLFILVGKIENKAPIIKKKK
jgi:hypothetical protein